MSAVTRSENSDFSENFLVNLYCVPVGATVTVGVGLQSSTLVPKRGEPTDTPQFIWLYYTHRGVGVEKTVNVIPMTDRDWETVQIY